MDMVYFTVLQMRSTITYNYFRIYFDDINVILIFSVWTNVTAFRKSSKTSAHKFAEMIKVTLIEVKCMIDSITIPKL